MSINDYLWLINMLIWQNWYFIHELLNSWVNNIKTKFNNIKIFIILYLIIPISLKFLYFFLKKIIDLIFLLFFSIVNAFNNIWHLSEFDIDISNSEKIFYKVHE